MGHTRRVVPFTELGRGDVGRVGGKNASLGELTRRLTDAGLQVPPGFATTADAYEELLSGHGLRTRIQYQLDRLHDGVALEDVGAGIRSLIMGEPLPEALTAEIVAAYEELGRELGRSDPEVAVRSSATAEDLPEASFAGQQDTYLNVCGAVQLVDAVHRCFASLYTDRAIDYRERMGFDHLQVALSVGVQVMVRSDLAGAGVIFTLDPESGFPHVVVVSAAWGLGETVVSGQTDPDEYTVFKPGLKDPALNPVIDVRIGAKRRKAVYAERGLTDTVDTTPEEQARRVLTDAEVRQLAVWAVAVEEHYGCPMDLEWAKDGITGDLAIVQARPETVQSRRRTTTLRRCRLTSAPGDALAEGIAVGEAIGAGAVCRMDTPVDMERFPAGAVLVTSITDPDWEPVMKRAAAIVTDHGGRTSHAAIVSRELGVPAVVGTGNATATLRDGAAVTVSCTEGSRGKVYAGRLPYEETETDLSALPVTRTRVMLNLADPSAAFRWPDPVVVRTSDFKTNEYAKLLGGRPFEPVEANPMIGWRGASRYYSDGYREGFALECQALRRVRDEMGLTNVIVMIPFCRTLEEADKVVEVMAAEGLRRGENGLKVYVMAEIPSNILLAQDFAERFDGFSIGSNDLTQLTLGVDRDSEALAHVFDENDPAVTTLIRILLPRVQALGRPVGLCGQRPSDDPAYAAFLVRAGIDSISVAPDGFAAVKQHVAAAEESRYGEDRTAPAGIRPAQADQPSTA
ncbi:phosphoenolpyruvate synthase [Streptomyces sp. NPDC001903]|uniref:phosphoenolpyruvate synthase n=1 Tax=Streptomyces sp. NPDC001903 TaxID=3364622 RepID=UPI003699319D